MGRITRLQNDIGHLNGVLAKKNNEIAVLHKAASTHKGVVEKTEARARDLEVQVGVLENKVASLSVS